MNRWLLFLLLLLGTPALSAATPVVRDTLGVDTILDRVQQLRPIHMDEVLWLARCLLSESDRANEQHLVAWVVRNRVETRFRGSSYREVVLEPYQFSAFNSRTPRRDYILSLDQYTEARSWRTALAIALDVYQAPSRHRPFDITTRHFYSPISMVGRDKPDWAESETPLSSTRLGVDPQRFQFFTGLDEGRDPRYLALDRGTDPRDVFEPGSEAATRPSLRGGSRLQPPRASGRVGRPQRPGMVTARPERPQRPRGGQ